MREQNLEKLFKETFGNYEADVNPNAWADISQQLQPSVPSPSPGASTGARTWGFWNYAGLFLGISAAVVVALIYSSENKPAQEISAPVNSGQTVTISLAEPPPIDEAPAPVRPELVKEIPVSKQAAQKAVEQIPAAEKTVADNDKLESPVSDNKASVTPPSPPSTSEAPVNEPAQPKVDNAEYKVNEFASDNSDAPVKENDFVLMTEQHENNAPREQESRSDFTIYIPTVFTPNGDLQNDCFKVMGLNFKDYQLVIYDGKSNEVFRSNDVEYNWDGKLKDGSLAPAGFYAVMISVKDLNNVEHPYQGQLLLKR